MTLANFGEDEDSWPLPELLQDSTEDIKSPLPFVLDPNSGGRLAWDVLLALSIVFMGLTLPFELIYLWDSMGTHGAVFAMHAVDVLWIIDIFVNFFTGFDSSAATVLDFSRIASKYLHGWLFLDVLTAWPLALTPVEGVLAGTVRLVKLLRLARLGPLITKLQKECAHRFLLPVKVGVVVLLLSHIMACMWRLARRTDGVIEDGLDRWDLYVEDGYWVMMTMTTIGYGDIVPNGTSSRLYAMAAMLVASIFFGATVSTLTHVTRDMFDDPAEKRVAEATNFMVRRAVPRSLQYRVQHALRFRLDQGNKMAMDHELFKLLSPAVQRELSLSLLSDAVLHFPLFEGAQRSFVAELAQAYSWVQCLPSDLVVEEGQRVEEVVFVVQGCLIAHLGRNSKGGALDVALSGLSRDILEKDSPSVRPSESSMARVPHDEIIPENQIEIETGAWFGEACLFEEGRLRTSTVVAATESDLAVLARQAFFDIIGQYPRVQQRYEFLQRAIEDGKVSLEDLRYKPVDVDERSSECSARWQMPACFTSTPAV